MVPVLQKEVDRLYRVIYLIEDGEEIAKEKYEDAVAVLSFLHHPIDETLAVRMPHLRVVSNFGAGYEHVDAKYFASRGIPCGHTPGAVNDATADLGMSLLLASARNVVEGDRRSKTLEIDRNWFGVEVTGATLGIVGLGGIGKAIAKRATGFSMKTLYNSRTRKAEDVERSLRCTFAPLDELLRQSDFVVLCVNLTKETEGLIGKTQLDMMKRSSTLVNIARGPVVDTDALVEALESGSIRGAALDVTDPEPLPKEHKLLKMRNVIVLPHIGSATLKTRRRMLDIALANLRAGLEGARLPHPCRTD